VSIHVKTADGWEELGVSGSSEEVNLGAWIKYTPTYSGFTLGNGSENHRYVQIGKFVFLNGQFQFGSTSTFTGTFKVGFPVPGNPSAAASHGSMNASEAGVGQYTGICVARPWADIVFYKGGSTPGAFTPGDPFTWGENDVLAYSVAYEAL
jgi:hypothetical protein